MKRLSLKRLLLSAMVATLAVAIPASAEARSCGPDRTTTDGTTIEVDAYGAASCSFARATASRFYAVDGVPRRLRVQGTRLTYRSKRSGSGWIMSPCPSPSPSPPPSSSCDANYQGACLDPYAVDYDCLGGSGDGPRYTGRVVGVGYDHYGLDAEGDGIGCESS
jgi:hypothetical protein